MHFLQFISCRTLVSGVVYGLEYILSQSVNMHKYLHWRKASILHLYSMYF